jgi:N6-L-threonylcarbamoyladenine synthase
MSANLLMNEINALAVTSQPGLAGSLIVGANFAKGLALRYNLPIVPVNHIDGHIYSGCLQDSSVQFPFVTLVISGGHTALFLVNSFSEYIILGSTVDDAAGEAFDKIASLFGLPYPGGPEIDKIAVTGNPKSFQFPRSMINSGDYHFSFSGLKTSVRYFIQKEFNNGIPENILPDLCASVQEAIVDVLVKKSIDAAIDYSVNTIVVGGGVSANSRMRQKLQNSAKEAGLQVVLPDLSYCMDNAAMIGFIAEKKLIQNKENYNKLDFHVDSRSLRKSGKDRKREVSLKL